MAAEGSGLNAPAAAVTRLVVPDGAHLAAYDAALARGYLPASNRGAELAAEHRRLIAEDPAGLLARMHDPDGRGPVVVTPDGSQHRRIPSTQRWMFDGPGGDEPGGFVGSISLRWNFSHAPLPPHVLGHIGYSVVPWAQRRGHATLLVAFEVRARESGCSAAYLETFSFQAPEFYRRQGWQAVHANRCFPHGIVKWTMEKAL